MAPARIQVTFFLKPPYPEWKALQCAELPCAELPCAELCCVASDAVAANCAVSVCKPNEVAVSIGVKLPTYNVLLAQFADNQPRAGVRQQVVITDPNIPGEIIIGGIGISAGYWNRTEESARAFGSFGVHGHCFFTGDQGYFNEQHEIVYEKRISTTDTFIKISGYRVELSDIEFAVCRLPHVRRCAAIYVERGKVMCILEYQTAQSESYVRPTSSAMIDAMVKNGLMKEFAAALIFHEIAQIPVSDATALPFFSEGLICTVLSRSSDRPTPWSHVGVNCWQT